MTTSRPPRTSAIPLRNIEFKRRKSCRDLPLRIKTIITRTTTKSTTTDRILVMSTSNYSKASTRSSLLGTSLNTQPSMMKMTVTMTTLKPSPRTTTMPSKHPSISWTQLSWRSMRTSSRETPKRGMTLIGDRTARNSSPRMSGPPPNR